MSLPRNLPTIFEDDFRVYEDDETFSFGDIEGHGIFKDFIKDIYLHHQKDAQMIPPNDDLPWEDEQTDFIHEQVFTPASVPGEVRLPFYLIAIKLGRSTQAVQDKVVELLDEKNNGIELDPDFSKAYQEATKRVLRQPLVGSVACVSAYELVNHLMYTFVHYPQFDSHYDAQLLNEMIENNYSINEMEEEMNHRTQGVFIDAYAMALRVESLTPMRPFHYLKEVNFFVYFDAPINELERYLQTYIPERLRERAAILSNFISTQVEINDFNEQIESFHLPLNTDDDYFHYETILSEEGAPRAWTSNDSITLKRGVLRGDSIAKIARETGRSPLSLLLQLLQRPDMADQEPLDEGPTSLYAIITRIAEDFPNRSIKQMTTAKQRKALSSSVLIVVDEVED